MYSFMWSLLTDRVRSGDGGTFAAPEQFGQRCVVGAGKGRSSNPTDATGSATMSDPDPEHRAQAKYPGGVHSLETVHTLLKAQVPSLTLHSSHSTFV